MNHSVRYEDIADKNLRDIVRYLTSHKGKVPLIELKLIDLVKDGDQFLTNGIYILFDGNDIATYIGKASNFLVDRFPQHLMVGNVGKMKNNVLLVHYIERCLVSDVDDWRSYELAYDAVIKYHFLFINTRFFDSYEKDNRPLRLKNIDIIERVLINAFYTISDNLLLNRGAKKLCEEDLQKTLVEFIF